MLCRPRLPAPSEARTGNVLRPVPATKQELPPIEAVEPPTFVRWRFKGTVPKMHPGQKYLSSPAASKIKVTAHELRYTGAGEMKGGRVRCHFEYPEKAVIRSTGFIQVSR
jgi:hypothetical protein